MTQEQLIILIIGALLLAVSIIIIPIATNSIKEKKDKHKNKNTIENEMLEDGISVKRVYAQVINVGCKNEGHKNHKIGRNAKQFVVTFRTDEDKILHFFVTEEYQDAFEFGQRGILTIVDGTLDSFELENK